MTFLLRTLSVSYVTRHVWKSALAAAGIAIGIATFVSIKTAQHTLVTGFGTTIDRLAGTAQLQVTGTGGVPEAMLDRIRDVPGVDLDQPIIEQVVQPEPATLGTLLIFGVDLVGDRSLRDYSFSGDDTDVDDPLIFLARPDSVALSRDFAARAGLRKGDTLTVRFGGVAKQLAVRALLEPRGFARAYGGNIAITDVYAAQTMFGRGRRFDRIDIRLQPSTTIDDGIAHIGRAIGSGFTVQTPERRGAQVEHLVSSFVNTFNVLGVVALAIGLYIIFNVFTIAVQRRRRDIGVLRALGATPVQVGTLFLIEAAVLGAIGSAGGVVTGTVLASRFIEMMSVALISSYGMNDATAPVLTTRVVGEAILVGVCASLVGAWMPARDAARVPPASAIAVGTFRRRAPIGRWRVPLGSSCLALAYVLGRFHVVSGPSLIFIVTGLGAVGMTALAGPAARAIIVPLAPVLTRIVPVAGRIAGDALLGNSRRTAGIAAVLSVSMALVLGIAGYLQAITNAVNRWVGTVITADLVVRASNGLGPSAVRLPASLERTLASVPGVRAADAYRNEHVDYHGQSIALVALGGDLRTRHLVVAGDATPLGTPQPGRSLCLVSENFARRYHIGLGDLVVLESPTGRVSLSVAAIITNFISDRGTVIVDRSLFADRWGIDQVDAFYVTLQPGANAARVRDGLRAALAGSGPALISTREEFVKEVDNALDAFQVLIRAVVTMALVIALMGVVTSLSVSTVERTRDIGILKAIGAGQRQLGGAIVCEAITLVTSSLILAVPLGALLSWFLRARVSEDYGGFRFPAAFPADTLALVLMALPIVAVAGAWLPARWAASLQVAEAVSYE